MGPSSREREPICVPGSRGNGTAHAPGAQRFLHGSDAFPLSATGEVKSSTVPPLPSQLVRKVPGCRPLGLELGTDPYRIPGAWIPEEGAGGTLCWDWKTRWLPGQRSEPCLHCRVDVVRHHGETGQGWSAHRCSDGYGRSGKKSPSSDQFVVDIDFWKIKNISGRGEA